MPSPPAVTLPYQGPQPGSPSPRGSARPRRVYLRWQPPFAPNRQQLACFLPDNEVVVPIAQWRGFRLRFAVQRDCVLRLVFCDRYGNPRTSAKQASTIFDCENFFQTQTFTINGVGYGCVINLSGCSDRQFIIIDSDYGRSIAATINRGDPVDPPSGYRTWCTGTAANPDVFATRIDANTILLTAHLYGAAGNAITTVTDQGSFSEGATLAGGVDGDKLAADGTVLTGDLFFTGAGQSVYISPAEHIGEEFIKVGLAGMSADCRNWYFDAYGVGA
ncbi:MAG: hypothetical protein OEO20_11520 [Gemmatimonadota bacterium]|nr:hypothetical protein [Gemmatimonadota bacterium]MDH3366534.1 hypothetical protein [Gemmatimonadota bacterium]MDH3478923.1 hypothetical protein [Gemmatimonadota bacterium]